MFKNYTKIATIFALIFICSFNVSAQNNQKLWKNNSSKNFANEAMVFRKSTPIKSQIFELNIESLKAKLQNAPNRRNTTSLSNLVIEFPNSEGKLESYKVMEASIMHEDLQARFPNIRSYVGQGIDNPTSVIRFSITPQGLHAMVLNTKNGTQYIDPYSKTSNDYIIYSKKDLPTIDSDFVCGVTEDISREIIPEDFDLTAARNANDGTMREYDLALACTIEYADFHVQAAGLGAGSLAQKQAAVLAAMNVTITRVNGIFENDLSLTLKIVPNNTNIIFINSDNFSNFSAGTLINESQTVIDGAIGQANYDIGHTFSTGGGGLAQLNSPCVNGAKARGITGLPNPVGDSYDVSLVAHEMGHQFGSPHTWNGSSGQCNPSNLSTNDAYEPGSGSTIMAYAGICGVQNIQGDADDYYHQRSLFRIWTNISAGNGSNCFTPITTGNSVPTANAGANYTIPISTPYKLTGTSTDADGTSTHTFTWEQYDLGPQGIPSETTFVGPLVRSFKGTNNPTRFIPRLEDLNTTGGSTTWEKLVSINRPINYRLTVRDNDSRGGQVAISSMVVNTSNAAGPFLVTSQNTTGILWTAGETQTVTWDSAGTDANGINVSNVNILLSTDGGLNYNTVLASNVPNSAETFDITVPSAVSSNCRIMVEAVGNIFFAINTEEFEITATVTCTDYDSPLNLNLPIADGTGTTTPNPGAATNHIINVSDIATIISMTVNVDVAHTAIGNLLVKIIHPNGTTSVDVWSENCGTNSDFDITFDDAAFPAFCVSPTTGTYIPDNPLSVFNGLNSAGNWTIEITDLYSGNTGVLNDWSLELCTAPRLNINEINDLNNFVIYPNPNNGEFTIKMSSVLSNKVNVLVYDIRGREIFNNSYNVVNEFSKAINLNNAQSGIYLVKVIDGTNNITTKKIIIN